MSPEARRESELIMLARPDGDRQLYHIAISRKDNVPPNMLLVGEPERAHVAAEFFEKGIEGQAAHREFVTLWGTYNGVRVAVMGTGIGTDNTEIASVELHAAHEYDPETDTWDEEPPKRNIIRVGTSASPQADVPLGSLAVTNYAIGLDNTGLSYLHHPSVDDYPERDGPYYTPNNPMARRIFRDVKKSITEASHGLIRPYVSTATPDVVEALQQAGGSNGIHTGITSSAPGFFAPQGRRIGRLSNVALPDLQERLAAISVQGPAGGTMRVEGADLPVTLEEGRIVRAVNNEMEASTLCRLNGEILGHNAGAICLVIANRSKGEFITPEEYQAGVRRAVKVALDALVTLAA